MILIFSVIFLLIFSNGLVIDPDLGWHLSLGQEIVSKRALIAHFDGYNYFAYLTRPDHEWLSNVALYEINKHFGYPGLVITFGIILALTIWLLYKILKGVLKSNRLALFLLFFSILPFMTDYGIRVQFILVFGLALLLYLKKFISSTPKRALWYFLVVLVINNFHGGFITLIPAILLLELDIFKQKLSRREKYKQYLIIALSLSVPLFVNPYGLDYIRLLASYGNGTYQSSIAEWLPIYSFPIAYKIIPIIIPLTVFIFVLTFDRFYRKLHYNEVVLLLIYGYLGIAHVRQFPIFIILAAPLAAMALKDLRQIVTSKAARNLAYLYIGLIILILFSYNQNLFCSVFVSKNWQNKFSGANGYPVEAANFISKNIPSTGNFLNPYDWGGFLSWAHPELKIFIDGRGPEKLVDDSTSIIQENQKFYSSDQIEITKKLQQYNISYILVQKPQGLDKLDSYLLRITGDKDVLRDSAKNNLEDYLEKNSAWQNVYDDEISQVYFLKK